MADTRWRVWLTGRDPDREDLVQKLEEAGCEVSLGRMFNDTWSYTEDQLIEHVREMDAIMVSTGDGIIGRAVMEASPRLKVISKRAIGVGDIDVKAATELGILVTNAPLPLHYLSVAEFTVAMMLGLANDLRLADHNARLGLWRSLSTTVLYGKTVGIIGLGRIGSRVAELLRPFEVKLIVYDPYVAPERAAEVGARPTDLESLLREADFVTLHSVESPASGDLIDEPRLRMMKPTAYIVNTARGSLIDEAALARALREGWIRGAALDVFKGEIPHPDNPLFAEEIRHKTIFSPHAASLNPDVTWAMPLLQLDNCLTALRGDVPPHVVNPEAVSRWRARLQAPSRPLDEH